MNIFNKDISKYLFGLDRYTKRAIAIIIDVLLCVIAVWLAFFIRLEEFILLKDIGFFGRDDKLNEILLLFQLNADAYQQDFSKILIYFDNLRIHFASHPITLPTNLTGQAINEYLTKNRI